MTTQTRAGAPGAPAAGVLAPVVDLRHITLFRGDTVILNDVSWRIERGEHWTLLGPNGSGKTTLLNIVSAYLHPSRGEATVLGAVFGRSDLRELRKRIGWVSSTVHALVPRPEIARDTVLSGRLAQLGVKDRHTAEHVARAEWLLESLGLADRVDHAFGTLSQGEQQKVLVARALMPAPRLLVLDEVSAALDLAAREALLEALDDLGRRDDGPTLIFVTHHVEEVTPVFSHALVLKSGAALACGPKDWVLTTRTLTAAMGIAVVIERANGRFWPRLGGT